MRKQPYALLAAALLGVYLVAAVALLATKDFDDRGPLSFNSGAHSKGPPPQYKEQPGADRGADPRAAQSPAPERTREPGPPRR